MLNTRRTPWIIAGALGLLSMCLLMTIVAILWLGLGPSRSAQLAAVVQTPSPLPPTLTVTIAPSATSVPTDTPTALPTSTATRTPEPTRTATRVSTPTPSPTSTVARAACPSWFSFPEPGKALLVIENHVGRQQVVDAMKPLNWTKTVEAKRDDVPGRLLIQLAPGHYEFRDHEVGTKWRGQIKVDLQPGQMLVSAIWHNDLYDEVVAPLQVPEGCQ